MWGACCACRKALEKHEAVICARKLGQSATTDSTARLPGVCRNVGNWIKKCPEMWCQVCRFFKANNRKLAAKEYYKLQKLGKLKLDKGGM